MRWNRKLRARLAKVIWEKSVEIDKEVNRSNDNIYSYMRERDRRIPLYFEGLGFSAAKVDEWCYDPIFNHPALFKVRGAYLFFVVCTQNVMKIEKEKAEKFLVLGLP